MCIITYIFFKKNLNKIAYFNIDAIKQAVVVLFLYLFVIGYCRRKSFKIFYQFFYHNLQNQNFVCYQASLHT